MFCIIVGSDVLQALVLYRQRCFMGSGVFEALVFCRS